MHLTKMHFYYRNTEERLCLYSGDKKIKKMQKNMVKANLQEGFYS